MMKFLSYAGGFLKEPELRALLRYRLMGWSYERIAWEFGRVDPEKVKKLEQIAIKKVKDHIARRRFKGIPILGGL